AAPPPGPPLGPSWRARISRRSMPEQKAGPSPRITTTRTSGFLSSASICSASPFSIARFIALRRSGRFMVNVATPPSIFRSSSAAIRLLAQQLPGDDHAVHFRRALADAADTGLAVPALQREFLGHAVTAVDLHGGVDDATQHLARVELGDGGLQPPLSAALRLPAAR